MGLPVNTSGLPHLHVFCGGVPPDCVGGMGGGGKGGLVGEIGMASINLTPASTDRPRIQSL